MNLMSISPPLMLLVAPWLLLALALSGPFLVLLVVAIAAVAVGALIAGVIALAAAPFVLWRRRRSAAQAPVAIEFKRVTA